MKYLYIESGSMEVSTHEPTNEDLEMVEADELNIVIFRDNEFKKAIVELVEVEDDSAEEDADGNTEALEELTIVGWTTI